MLRTQLVIIIIASSTQVLTILLGSCKVFVHAVLFILAIEWSKSSNSATRGDCSLYYVHINHAIQTLQPSSTCFTWVQKSYSLIILETALPNYGANIMQNASHQVCACLWRNHADLDSVMYVLHTLSHL